jgi:hypothetical protein
MQEGVAMLLEAKEAYAQNPNVSTVVFYLKIHVRMLALALPAPMKFLSLRTPLTLHKGRLTPLPGVLPPGSDRLRPSTQAKGGKNCSVLLTKALKQLHDDPYLALGIDAEVGILIK